MRKHGLTLKVQVFLFAAYTIYWGKGIWHETCDTSNYVASRSILLKILKDLKFHQQMRDLQ